jgi:hypothetical protein
VLSWKNGKKQISENEFVSGTDSFELFQVGRHIVILHLGGFSSGLTENDGLREPEGIVRIQRYSRLRLIKGYPNLASDPKKN